MNELLSLVLIPFPCFVFRSPPISELFRSAFRIQLFSKKIPLFPAHSSGGFHRLFLQRRTAAVRISLVDVLVAVTPTISCSGFICRVKRVATAALSNFRAEQDRRTSKPAGRRASESCDWGDSPIQACSCGCNALLLIFGNCRCLTMKTGLIAYAHCALSRCTWTNLMPSK